MTRRSASASSRSPSSVEPVTSEKTIVTIFRASPIGRVYDSGLIGQRIRNGEGRYTGPTRPPPPWQSRFRQMPTALDNGQRSPRRLLRAVARLLGRKTILQRRVPVP